MLGNLKDTPRRHRLRQTKRLLLPRLSEFTTHFVMMFPLSLDLMFSKVKISPILGKILKSISTS